MVFVYILRVVNNGICLHFRVVNHGICLHFRVVNHGNVYILWVCNVLDRPGRRLSSRNCKFYSDTGTTQHSTAQHSTAQHNTAQHSTAEHNTTQHNTTQHDTTWAGHVTLLNPTLVQTCEPQIMKKCENVKCVQRGCEALKNPGGSGGTPPPPLPGVFSMQFPAYDNCFSIQIYRMIIILILSLTYLVIDLSLSSKRR